MSIHDQQVMRNLNSPVDSDEPAVLLNPGAFLRYCLDRRMSLARTAMVQRAMLRSAERDRVPKMWQHIVKSDREVRS